MPLRPTELLFVDQQTVACPCCTRMRPISAESCRYCGGRDVLGALSQQSANFHLSSLLLLTTVIAVCFALTRISLVLGIPAFTLTGLATLRTALLIRLRKQHRYPVSTHDAIRLFGTSTLGITLALFVFAGTCMGGGFMLGSVLGGLAMGSQSITIVVFVLVLIVSAVGAVAVVGTRRAGRRMLLAGFGAAWAFGLATYIVARLADPDVIALMLLVNVLSAAFAALVLACRRGGSVLRKIVPRRYVPGSLLPGRRRTATGAGRLRDRVRHHQPADLARPAEHHHTGTNVELGRRVPRRPVTTIRHGIPGSGADPVGDGPRRSGRHHVPGPGRGRPGRNGART